MTSKNPLPQEDAWAFQPIGSPFPDNPVKVYQQQNMYVALWYKHGKPVHGRSWNNGGVVECSFPMGKRELTGAQELGGQIQVLQYKGDHNTLGFWYNWIRYKDRFDNAEKKRELVRCGGSIPILWADRKEGALLGDLEIKTETARFSHDKIAEELQGKSIEDMLIIVRELTGAPSDCMCKNCDEARRTCKTCKTLKATLASPCKCTAPPPPPPPHIHTPGAKTMCSCSFGPGPRTMYDSWADFKEGDPFPTTSKAIRAMFKSLVTLPGENQDQYVALWYQHGEPVMGRVWNDGGKIAANFSWGGNEYKSKIGSLQILFEMPDHVRGFEYEWRPYPEAASFGEKEWLPIHVDSHGKVNVSPGVMTVDGKQILGKVDIKNEKASYGYGGKEVATVGPAVHTAMVLCRKARPGCKFD